MPTNPHFIKHTSRDAGTAQQLADIRRRLQKAEGKANYTGHRAVIPSMTMPDASGAQVVFQAPSNVGGGAGVFVEDAGGNVDVALTPTNGITLTGGITSPNQINWVDTYGGTDVALIGYSTFGASGALGLQAWSASGDCYGVLSLVATNGGHGAVNFYLYSSGGTLLASHAIWTF